jgi:hypothetical protein
MQRVTLVRYTTQPDRTPENEALSRAVFAELRSAAPANVAYALFRDGNEFLHLFVNMEGDASDPLTELPAFKEFSKNIKERCEVPPQPTRITTQLVESYGFARGGSS